MDEELSLGSNAFHVEAPAFFYAPENFPPREESQIKAELEKCFQGRSIYKDPDIRDDDLFYILDVTGKGDIKGNERFNKKQLAIDNAPAFIVPSERPEEFKQALQFATRLLAERVLIPMKKVNPEQLEEYVQTQSEKIYRHELEHKSALPVGKGDIPSFYRIVYTYSLELMSTQGDERSIRFQDEMHTSFATVTTADKNLTPEEHLAIVSKPGDDMSPKDKAHAELLRQQISKMKE